jgi:hypothetical protein
MIGFLGSAAPESFAERLQAFRRGLAEIGFVEGQNVEIEFRWANNQLDQLPRLVQELVQRRVTVIAAPGNTAATIAAKAATATIVFYIAGEVQNTALEIKDHRVISRAMQRSFGNLTFEGLSADVQDQQRGLVSARSRLIWSNG